MHPFRVGKQEHRIPILTSMFDQMAANGFSQVISVAFEIAYREESRRIDTRHVLEIPSSVDEKFDCYLVYAYKPPKANIIIKIIRCRLGKQRLLRTGSGRMAVTKSVIILMVAFENLQYNLLSAGIKVVRIVEDLPDA